MAFLQNGTWVPDQQLNTMPMSQMQTAGLPQVAQQQTRMQNMPQGMPIFTPGVSMMPGSLNFGATPQNQPPANAVQMSAPMATQGAGNMLNATQMQQNAPQMQQAPQQLGGGGYAPQHYADATQHPQSVMQSVNNASPQSVQNFLQALQQNPNVAGGYASGNAWQNPQGMQGQGPQAGFQGFGQGNPPPYQPTNWQPYQNNQNNAYADATQHMRAPQSNASANPYSNLQYQPPPKLSENTNQSGHPNYGGTLQYQAPQKTNPYPENTNQSGRPPTHQLSAAPTSNLSPYQNMAASDIQLKQQIQPGQNELQDFLNSLGVHSYEYKDEKYGEGRRISPMAQEIEQTPLGQAAISTNAEGYKMVDYGKLGGTMLASLALLNHKYNELETQLKTSLKASLKAKGKI